MMGSVKIRTRYAIVGSDYSAQEPRILCHLANEPKFREIFEKDLDPYASISSLVFKKDYWECMEHHQDGSPNPEGKKLRKKAKQIMLGVSYGMGAKLMSKNLGVSIEECKNILDEFYKVFPKLKEYTQHNEQQAKEIGYVEDYMGRRRHLTDAQLPEIDFRAKKDVYIDWPFMDNASIEDKKIFIDDDDSNHKWETLYNEQYKNRGYNAKVDFKELAKKENIDLLDNGAFISKTLTQCTNATIQGSAATLTKKAMVDIYNNKELKDLGFRLLIPIHDELLGECPIVNKDKVEKLLSETMINAAKGTISTPMKCDPYVVNRWYADEVSNELYDDYHKALDKGEESDSIIKSIQDKYSEFSKETIEKMCLGTYDVLSGEI